jgi:hypothetical protein
LTRNSLFISVGVFARASDLTTFQKVVRPKTPSVYWAKLSFFA